MYLVAKTEMDWDETARYLEDVGGSAWFERMMREAGENPNPGESLAEFAGRMCYRAWEPGLNPNVTKVREDSAEYLKNVLRQGHGSVLEHASFTFVLQDVSRILTHELVRHRVGTAISQESMRYVRLDKIPFWIPAWAAKDSELMGEVLILLRYMEVFQEFCAGHFGLDDPGMPFAEKKHKTSFMRRLAPEGVATSMTWTSNIRTLRHVITLRTDESAEEEIRLVAFMIGRVMKKQCPLLFGDFEEVHPGGNPGWPTKLSPKYRKV